MAAMTLKNDASLLQLSKALTSYERVDKQKAASDIEQHSSSEESETMSEEGRAYNGVQITSMTTNDTFE